MLGSKDLTKIKRKTKIFRIYLDIKAYTIYYMLSYVVDNSCISARYYSHNPSQNRNPMRDTLSLSPLPAVSNFNHATSISSRPCGSLQINEKPQKRSLEKNAEKIPDRNEPFLRWFHVAVGTFSYARILCIEKLLTLSSTTPHPLTDRCITSPDRQRGEMMLCWRMRYFESCFVLTSPRRTEHPALK
ncbi:uncharacterized protein BDW43DRAFT_24573 [Aspergillus alliaceus]|uniref:uncharacterized protein n=1 Tax=Petromyces alliaceus TaxID=209559 RepID=UPI0012A3CA5E|nr:uncharacterized protein BDW43DRAFT_24573 [Aspergillus alliaceus]KAB8235637.1 hypothetical protein BDW43DRAFT_24573 [Aspergillus alliaceus]